MNMSSTFGLCVSTGLAFLIGSISFSYLAGRLKQRDLRDTGSGNLGAMNTARVLGPLSGAIVLALDMGKGFAAVWMARRISPLPMAVFLACLAVMLGHNYSLFLRFTGGKGIAVVGGFLILLSPQTLLAELVVAGVSFLIFRDIHVAGIAMIFAIAPLLGFFHRSWSYFLLGLALAGLSSLRHKKNFAELWDRMKAGKPA